MKPRTLLRLVFVVLTLAGCGREETQSASLPATVNYAEITPSTATCNELQQWTASNPPTLITGYAENATVNLDGMAVSQMDQYGNVTPVGTQSFPVGTYCTIYVVNGQLSSVALSPNPGCLPGWGQGC